MMIIKCVAHSLNLALLTQKEKNESEGKRAQKKRQQKEMTQILISHTKRPQSRYTWSLQKGPRRDQQSSERQGAERGEVEEGEGEAEWAKPKRKRVNWQI